MAAVSPDDVWFERVLATCGETKASAEFVAALRVELGVAAVDAESLPELRDCDAKRGKVTVVMARRDVTLDVSDVPGSGRARTLAVALVETLRIPAAELDAIEGTLAPGADRASPPRPRTLPAPNTTEAPRGSETPRHVEARRILEAQPHRANEEAWQVPVGVRAVVLGPRRTLAVGIHAGVGYAVTPQLRLLLGAGYLTMERRSVLGEVRVHAVDLDAALALTVFRPGPNARIDVGAGLQVYRTFIDVDSTWGFDEPNRRATVALGHVFLSLSTALSRRIHTLMQLHAVKDIVGVRLRGGAEELVSLYGFGAELRLGAVYVW